MPDSSRPEASGTDVFVRLEVDAGVGTIRLDRPPVNAMNFVRRASPLLRWKWKLIFSATSTAAEPLSA